MRFGIVALIVSLAATASWLNLAPGSTGHWIASGAGAAFLVYLRHRVRRRGLRGLWRWGKDGESDEAFHFLKEECGTSFWSQFRPQPPNTNWRTNQNLGNDRNASRTPKENYTSCRSFVIVWSRKDGKEVIRRVRLEPYPNGARGLARRDIFTLDDKQMERLKQHLEANDPKGIELLSWIVCTAKRHPPEFVGSGGPPVRALEEARRCQREDNRLTSSRRKTIETTDYESSQDDHREGDGQGHRPPLT